MAPLLEPSQDKIERLEEATRNARLRSVAALGGYDQELAVINAIAFFSGAVPVAFWSIAVLFWAFTHPDFWAAYQNIRAAMAAVMCMLVIPGVIIFPLGGALGRAIAVRIMGSAYKNRRR